MSSLALFQTPTPKSNSASVCRLRLQFSASRPSDCRRTPFSGVRVRGPLNDEFRRPNLGSISSSFFPLRGLGTVVSQSVRARLGRISCSADSFASGSGGIRGNDGVGGGSGGGGDGAAEGGEAKANVVAGAGGTGDITSVASDVIILDVGGMTCGGCAASVKRILESQPKVFSADVNLTTETAIVWPVSEAKIAPNWRKDLGEALAKHLTTCGFKSNLRGEGANEGDALS